MRAQGDNVNVYIFHCPLLNMVHCEISPIKGQFHSAPCLSWSGVKPQTSHCQYKLPCRVTAQTDSTENWKEGGKGDSAVVTEPITSVCECLLQYVCVCVLLHVYTSPSS